MATSGRFRTYAFWVQDDFKVNARLALNLGLRYDIMKPYTEVYDRWSFMNPDLPNPAVGGYPGAMQFAGFGDNSCQCRTPIETYYGSARPAPRRRLQPERPHGAARLLRDHVLAARRRRRPRRRAQRHRHARLLGQRVVPEHRTGSRRPTTGTTACRRIPLRRSSIRRSTPASSPGAATAAASPTAIRRSAAVRRATRTGTSALQYALTSKITVGAAYAGSDGDFLGGSGRGFYANQLDPALPRARQPADADGQRRPTSPRRGPSCPASRCPTPTSPARSRQMLRPFPQYSRRHRRLRQRRALELPLAAAHASSSGAGTA